MAIEIKCKLVTKLQVQNGSSAKGPWSKQDFVVETVETYPKKICMNVWGGEKVAELGGFNPGEMLSISVNIESREFQGRWYTDVRAWRIQRDIPQQQQTQQYSGIEQDPFMNVSSEGVASDEGDLPF